MPVDEKLKVRANAALSRVAGEIEQVKADQVLHAKCVSDSALLLSHIATTTKARTNLTDFSARAVKLAEAYSANASNLRDDAEISDDLRAVNWRLAFFYFATAVGKIADVVASATGLGKVVTTAKNSFVDMTDAMRKQDGVTAGAQAANLTLIMVGGEAVDITKSFDDLQKCIGAILGLIKDLKAIATGNDLPKFLASFKQATPQMLELIAKFSSALYRLTSLWTVYKQSQFDRLPINLNTGKMVGGPQLSVVAAEKAKNLAALLGAIKYGIEAVANLWRCVCSFMDFWENLEARNQANALSDRQLTATGVKFDLSVEDMAGMSNSDMVEAMHSLNNAPDARQLAMDAFSKAKRLQAEAVRMQQMHDAMASRLGPVTDRLSDNMKRLETTGTELDDLRKEFQAVEPGRTVYSLQVAVWLSDIDSKRGRIAETVCH